MFPEIFNWLRWITERQEINYFTGFKYNSLIKSDLIHVNEQRIPSNIITRNMLLTDGMYMCHVSTDLYTYW